MNVYAMKAYHHNFDVFHFHQQPLFKDWFNEHIDNEIINEPTENANDSVVIVSEENEFQVAPEHLLLLSDNTAIFNRFKFNHNLHLPSPYCRCKIVFGNDDHNISTNETIIYPDDAYAKSKIAQLAKIKIGFAILSEPFTTLTNLSLTFPNIQWHNDPQWTKISEAGIGEREIRNVWCQDGNRKVNELYCAHLPNKPASVQGIRLDVAWIEVNASRPQTPQMSEILMLNPKSMKVDFADYEEMVDELRDESEIKAEYERWISALIVVLLSMLCGFPCLWVWRRVFHGDTMYQIEFDAAFEDEQQYRQRSNYM